MKTPLRYLMTGDARTALAFRECPHLLPVRVMPRLSAC